MSNLSSNFLPSLAFVFITLTVFGQDEIKWSFRFDRSTNSLEFKGELKEHWHLYSQFIDENLGPIPTTFVFTENHSVELIGKIEEQNVKTIFDENFGGQLDILEDSAIFTQKINWHEPTTVKGSILFMLCDDQGCLPPNVVDFEIELN